MSEMDLLHEGDSCPVCDYVLVVGDPAPCPMCRIALLEERVERLSSCLAGIQIDSDGFHLPELHLEIDRRITKALAEGGE